MNMVIQFVMLVVSILKSSRQPCRTNPLLPGLYHKLHGSHRPVAMKKSTIKRRKRVVPAPTRDGSPATMNDSSASPEQRSTALPSIDTPSDRVLLPSRPAVHNPPPVDFTGWRANPTTFGPTLATPPPSTDTSGLARGRKRSISSGPEAPEQISNDSSQPIRHSISSLLNPQSAQVPAESNARTNVIPSEPPVDPSLLSLSQAQVINRQSSNQQVSPTPSPQPTTGSQMVEDTTKAERRTQLLKEAEDMRQMLRRKEMELADLE